MSSVRKPTAQTNIFFIEYFTILGKRQQRVVAERGQKKEQ
jgi:hypothetical protein